MNLTIDQGNSYTKTGIFKDDELVCNYTVSNSDAANKIAELFTAYPIVNSIISSVIESDPAVIEFLKNRSAHFVELDENTLLPVKNRYKTPSTLGKDRIVAAVAANYLKPSENNLVIDAGTCITYEFVNAAGEYLGGNISPGVNMRLKALNYYTQKLPLIEPDQDFNLLGNDTRSAILSGVMNGITFEIEGYINALKKKYTGFNIFFTGGDTFFFETTFKNSIFAVKNLLLIGLNRILNYNV